MVLTNQKVRTLIILQGLSLLPKIRNCINGKIAEKLGRKLYCLIVFYKGPLTLRVFGTFARAKTTAHTTFTVIYHYSSVLNRRTCTFIFFLHFFPSLYVLFGSVCLIVFQEKKMVCILLRDNFFIKS